MNLRHRPWALLVALLASFSLVAAACGDDDDGDASGDGQTDGSADVSELTLGGPPDCPENPFCIPGLQEVYDVDFSDRFVSLDGGGPLTVEALQGEEIDVAVLFSTNPQIAVNDWVVLDDTEGLINADNVIPVMTDDLVDAYGSSFESLVNEVSNALTTEELTELNRQFEVELMDADDVAEEWLSNEGLLTAGDDAPPDGPTITIGAQEFPESEVLAQVYGQALDSAGYPVEYQALGGFRDIVYASFDSGDINFTAEYAASALEFLNENAGEATSDAEETAQRLRGQLEDEGLTATEVSPAVDSNSFVVTQETADEYGLESIGDLAG